METKTTTLAEQTASVARRLKALGLSRYPVPVNNGTRRTESKRALLACLAERKEERQHHQT